MHSQVTFLGGMVVNMQAADRSGLLTPDIPVQQTDLEEYCDDNPEADECR